MLVIPLQPVKSQDVGVILAQQPVRLNVYQKATGFYVDILLNDSPVLTGVLALAGVRMVRNVYLGFIGDLMFVDTQPASEGGVAADPDYTGLGSRWVLFYLETADVAGDV